MVIGIGVDVVTVGRIGALWERHPARLRESVFTPRELAEGGLIAPAPGSAAGVGLTVRQAQYLTERFAGKEAVIKVLGLGHADPFELTDIEIMGSRLLAVRLGGALVGIAARQGIGRVTGSCSSTSHTTVALMIGESSHD